MLVCPNLLLFLEPKTRMSLFHANFGTHKSSFEQTGDSLVTEWRRESHSKCVVILL